MTTPTQLPCANAQESPGQHARKLLKTLQSECIALRDCLPLAIGIDKAIRLRFPDIDRKALRIALGMHTHSMRYLKALCKATHRFDLDGNAVAEIPTEHRQHAIESLRQRTAQEAERRKAERQQEKLVHREQQHREKLNQLVKKFNHA